MQLNYGNPVEYGLPLTQNDPVMKPHQAKQEKRPADRAGSAFRVVQISDCHLSASAETRYRGEYPDAGLEALSHRIAAWQPQLVLATGDLSEDASGASYQRLAGCLERIGAPVCAVPGNHDDAALMQQYFPCGPWNGPLSLTAGDWRLILLGSACAGRIDGVVHEKDLEEVFHMLETGPGQPVLLALHHHPVAAGSRWIDRHMLESPGPLLRLIADHEWVRGVVWGHVHQAYEARCGRARMLACPSTAANSLPGTPRFELDPAGPACRWLQLGAGGTLETGVLLAGSGSGQQGLPGRQ